jgi:hypothetical protein
MSADPVIACIGTSKGRNWLGYFTLNKIEYFPEGLFTVGLFSEKNFHR